MFRNGLNQLIAFKDLLFICSKKVKQQNIRLFFLLFLLDIERSIDMSTEQENDFKKLEKLRGWGHAAADLKRRKISLSCETLTAVDDDDTEADFFEIEEDPVLNLAQSPIMLTSRLVSLTLQKKELLFLVELHLRHPA